MYNLSSVKKQALILTYTACIFVLMILCMPFVTHAASVYDEEGSGSTIDDGGVSALIGSFTTDGSSYIIGSNSVVSATYEQLGGFCNGNSTNIYVGTTNSPSSGFGFFWALPATGDNGHFHSFTGTTTYSGPDNISLSPYTTYYVFSYVNCSGQLNRYVSSSVTNNFTGFITDTTGVADNRTTTNISQVFPATNSTVGSGNVTLGAKYFISQNDASGICALTGTSSSCDFYLKFTASNFDNLEQPVTNWQFYTIAGFPFTSTTSMALPNGFYAGRWSITANGLELVATTTNFTVGSSGLTATSTDYLKNPSAVAFQSPAECKGLNFLSVECIVALIKPNAAQKQYLYDQLTVDFFDKIPFSYVVRFKTMVDASTTNSLPYINYTFASSSPLSGTNITFNPWLYTYDATNSPLRTLTDPSTGKDVWQIFKAPTETFVYMLLIFMIINDLTHIHVSNKQNL